MVSWVDKAFSPPSPPRRLVQLSFWCPGGECGTVSLESGSSDGAACAQRWKFLQVLFLRVTMNSCIWYVAVWATRSVFPSRDGSWSIRWLILTTFSNRSGMWWVGSGNSWKSQALCMLKITENWSSRSWSWSQRRERWRFWPSTAAFRLCDHTCCTICWKGCFRMIFSFSPWNIWVSVFF